MTDATGRSFISYKRSREHEAALLLGAQHDVGIPTWQDQKDLDTAPVGEELRQVLKDKYTASGLLWITPEVKDSDVIRKIEAPLLLQRANDDDGFFLVPVCAGGMDYEAAAEAVDQKLSAETLRQWNVMKVSGDPISAAEAASVAARILKRRIEKIDKQLDKKLALKISLNTREPLAFEPGTALALDWFERFNGREAEPAVWQNTLLPALSKVAKTIRVGGGGRAVMANGVLSIPAATALGVAFSAESRLKIAWSQSTAGRPDQVWSLDSPREPSGFASKPKDDFSADDLAVLVSITKDVEPAFARSKGKLPRFRGLRIIAHPRNERFDIQSPGQAVDIARTVQQAIDEARGDYRSLGTVHLFMAGPVGLAMMIGQLLNTVGAAQTYEHIAVGNVYHPAVLLHPSG